MRGSDPALLAALRLRGLLSVTVTITPEGIADLVGLNWLNQRSCRDAAAVADAITGLASAALDAGLQP
jgi:hypothetical protein